MFSKMSKHRQLTMRKVKGDIHGGQMQTMFGRLR